MNQAKNVRVLVAEDDYLVSEMIQGLLEEMGYTIAGAAVTGFEAIEMCRSLQPDALLIDVRLPDIDGLEVARFLQQHAPLPVVVLTAYETTELVEQAGQVGAGAYLVKPPNGREIERAITIAIARFKDLVKLHELNSHLQASNAELDTFAHTVAHDLQNPLGLILGFSELLVEERAELASADAQEYLGMITRHAQKMSKIIDELLLLSGVRRMEIVRKPVSMQPIVLEAQQRLEQMIKEHKAEILVPDTWPVALGYGPWLEEVWVNYISNAIKYGGTPPRLEMGADACNGELCGADACGNGMIRFWLRDNGEGLTAEEQTRLFIPFIKLNRNHHPGQGHGLGLSIVERIVTKLGGDVGVTSEPGRGSTFWFCLPGEGEG
jgi:two-component system, sensor histidine kinase and response regulator